MSFPGVNDLNDMGPDPLARDRQLLSITTSVEGGTLVPAKIKICLSFPHDECENICTGVVPVRRQPLLHSSETVF
jgi:hypothetical protein